MTILYGIIGLGFIVFIHELGHFIAARKCGVEVETFSIGMGPVLVHKKIGKTDYRLSLIPLGGYCGMKGEKMFQEAIEKKLDSIPREKDSFYGVSPIRRIIIAFSGPAFNLFFAILALAVISMIGYKYYSTPSKIILATDVYSDISSPAKNAGLLTGDTIIEIDGKPVQYFSDISEIVSTSPQETLTFLIERNGNEQIYTITTELDTNTGAGRIGVINWIEPVIHSVKENSLADVAGLKTGDTIMAVAGFPIHNTMDFTKIIQNRDSVELAYVRNGNMHATVLSIPGSSTGALDVSTIGLTWDILEVKSKTYSFFPALVQGSKEAFNLLSLTIKSISLLFRGVDLTKAVSGPIGITVMLGETTKQSFEAGFSVGVVSVLNFLALISISLFFMNLLPIPILDGGLILFSAIEWIRGKAVKPTIMYKVQFIGVGFIVFLFIIGFIGDINRLISGSF